MEITTLAGNMSEEERCSGGLYIINVEEGSFEVTKEEIFNIYDVL